MVRFTTFNFSLKHVQIHLQASMLKIIHVHVKKNELTFFIFIVGYYMYIEASGKFNGQTAYLTSQYTYTNDQVDRYVQNSLLHLVVDYSI